MKYPDDFTSRRGTLVTKRIPKVRSAWPIANDIPLITQTMELSRHRRVHLEPPNHHNGKPLIRNRKPTSNLAFTAVSTPRYQLTNKKSERNKRRFHEDCMPLAASKAAFNGTFTYSRNENKCIQRAPLDPSHIRSIIHRNRSDTTDRDGDKRPKRKRTRRRTGRSARILAAPGVKSPIGKADVAGCVKNGARTGPKGGK